MKQVQILALAMSMTAVSCGVKQSKLVYPETARRVRELYAAFCRQWERECKPNGFEVHDIRLGGLACRLEHCGRLLCEYAAGSIGKIDPLDEDPLPMEKGKERGEGLLYSIWLNTAMTKPLN